MIYIRVCIYYVYINCGEIKYMVIKCTVAVVDGYIIIIVICRYYNN